MIKFPAITLPANLFQWDRESLTRFSLIGVSLMKQNLLVIFMVVFGVLLGGCESTGVTQSNAAATSTRPDADIARDAGRKPFAVLAFLGVEEGMTTVDLIAASGYYTEVLSRVVGPTGRVYAQNPARVLRFRGGANDLALNNRLLNNRLNNVRRLDREIQDLGLVANSVDVVITALNFHDIYNNSPEAAQGALATIKGVLKPGGVLGIIDHHGNPGADNKSLHRMLVQDAVSAAEAAGFIVESSDLLENSADDRSQGVFAPAVRGNTDRFLLKLTKPAA